MNSLDEVLKQLVFIDDQNSSEPGLIAMLLHNQQEAILVFFNASRTARTYSNKVMSYAWQIHPYLDASIDPVLSQVVLNPSQSQIQIPGRSTVVLRLPLSTKPVGGR